ncbi:MAG TPA: hypothetical protein ENI62_09675 [Gammaproteobacteria bacterium]|nr:hypothetical protein [Gammaproteobacteria bacterium]
MMKAQELADQAQSLWPLDVESCVDASSGIVELCCKREQVPHLCDWLFNHQAYLFAGLIVEENTSRWDLFYLFVGQGKGGCVRVRTSAALEERQFQSVSVPVHAADWHEREAEDLFGLVFEGHPRLGDFILHDDTWQEGVEPMRNNFDPAAALSNRQPRENACPRRIVDVPGAFVMPIGPVFSGTAESVHFQLETVGEEVLRAFPRLFFKYRGVEKRAEGCSVDQALLLAERFAGTTAFAHAFAFAMAIEQISDREVPERAQVLRIFVAELERLRSHLSTIEGICASTGLAVAANQTAILEEEALRLSGSLTGHRYLFGLVIPGGLSRDCDNQACRQSVIKARDILQRLDGIDKLLINTSSFLDRIEEVGVITQEQAHSHGLVGPVARGSGCCSDLRRLQPYGGYDTFDFETPCEVEGDGYARLRILFAEAKQSVRIMEQALERLPAGPVFLAGEAAPGVVPVGVETPRGATWHWLRMDEERKLTRYRLITPSFTNWHGFHLAAENFAFQDFPIILATFGLSVAENDR